jgi:peptide chain release factor 1
MIPKNELKVDTFRSSGKGGQNVNKVSSAVRLTHLPTGIVATCQDERSQAQNYARAMSVLEMRLKQYRASLLRTKLDKFRATLYTGRVRTYDFTRNVVTDYRTKKQTSRLKDVLEGDLDLVR